VRNKGRRLLVAVGVALAAIGGYLATRPFAAQAPADVTPVTVTADGDADVSTVVRSYAGGKIHIDADPVRHGYIHFTLAGTNGARHAQLTIYAKSDQSVGFDVHATGADWTQDTIRWATAPPVEQLLGSSGPVTSDTAYTFDVPINGDGPVAFELETSNARSIAIATSEGDPGEAPRLTFTPLSATPTDTTTTDTRPTTTDVTTTAPTTTADTTTTVETTSTPDTTTTAAPTPPPTTTSVPATTTTPVSSSGPCGTVASSPQRYDHVVWIFMENESRSGVIGSSSAPYQTQLANECGQATNYRNNGSPSLPNYIAATSGSTQGITDDADPSSHPLTVDNIFRQVRAAGGSAISYAESMPGNCTLTSSGDYLVRHVPATYYTGADDRTACQRDVVPFTQFDPNNLPTFAFITPNRCDDAHDCPVSTGDKWLASHVPAILASPEYTSGKTLLVITYDESGTLPFIAASAAITPGTTTGTAYTHYGLLRLTEDLLGLPRLGGAASSADMRADLGL
jgi:hypothetical protein